MLQIDRQFQWQVGNNFNAPLMAFGTSATTFGVPRWVDLPIVPDASANPNPRRGVFFLAASVGDLFRLQSFPVVLLHVHNQSRTDTVPRTGDSAYPSYR